MVSQRFTDVPTVQRMLHELRQIGDHEADKVIGDFRAELENKYHTDPNRQVPGPERLVRELTTLEPKTRKSICTDSECIAEFKGPKRRLPAWAQHYDPVKETEQWSLTDCRDEEYSPSGTAKKFLKQARGQEIQRAIDFFDAYGLPISAALLYASLPYAYGSQRGSQILSITGELVSHPARRVRQTAHFVVQMMTPDPDGLYNNAGSLLPGHQAANQARHVRLVHAAVRRMFETGRARDEYEAALRGFDAAAEQGEIALHGHHRPIETEPQTSGEQAADYQTPTSEIPISQAQLLATLLTFTVTVFEALDKLGVPYEPEDKEAYYFLWNVAAAHLGLGDVSAGATDDQRDVLQSREFFGRDCSLLPITPEEGERLMPIILDEEHGDSIEGRVLTKALLQELSRTLPQNMKAAPAAMMRHLLGDELANMLGVPIGGWTDFAYRRLGGKRFLDRRTRKRSSVGSLRRALNAEFSARLSRAAINGFMALNDPRATDFNVPDRLSERWSLKESAANSDLAPFDELDSSAER